MADQDDATKIVIEIVDKFSKPLTALRKELEGLSSKGGDGANKTAKGFETLRQSIHSVASTVTSTLMPSLKVLGLGFAGVAGTLATFVAGLKSLGGSINELTRLGTETKISIDKMRELESVGRRVGITAEQMRAGFRGFSEEMDKLRIGTGDLQKFFGTHGISWLGTNLRGIKDINKQLDYTLETIDRMTDPRQKRLVLERLQLPANLAQIPRAERERAIEEYRKTVGPLDKATKDSALRFDEAMTNMGLAWEKFINQLAKKGGLDDFTKLLNLVSGSAGKIADEVSKAARDLKSIYSDLVKINDLLKNWKNQLPDPVGDWKKKGWRGFLPHFTTPNESVEQRFWQPQSLPGGGGEEPKKLIKEGTSEGVVDAFKKMALDMGGDSAAGGGNTFGGASVIRASLGGGGGGGGGRRGGGGGGGDPASPDSDASDTPAVRSLAMDRARFAKELATNPALREKVLGIAAGENKDPTAATSVIETMMNRASQRGTTLEQAARLTREPGGYYAGYDPGSLRRPEIRKRMEDALKRALGGSNASDYATDNSSGGLAEREKRSGTFRFHKGYGGESFFSPGTSGRGAAGRERYERWRKNLQETDIPMPRPRPPEADRPEVPRTEFRYAANKSNQSTRVEGDATVRIDLAGLSRGIARTPGGGVFSDVPVHGGNTAPVASENA
jgi:hypothetical protein